MLRSIVCCVVNGLLLTSISAQEKPKVPKKEPADPKAAAAAPEKAAPNKKLPEKPAAKIESTGAEKKPGAETDVVKKPAGEKSDKPGAPTDAERPQKKGFASKDGAKTPGPGAKGLVTKIGVADKTVTISIDGRDYEFAVTENTVAALKLAEQDGKQVVLGVQLFNVGEGIKKAAADEPKKVKKTDADPNSKPSAASDKKPANDKKPEPDKKAAPDKKAEPDKKTGPDKKSATDAPAVDKLRSELLQKSEEVQRFAAELEAARNERERAIADLVEKTNANFELDRLKTEKARLELLSKELLESRVNSDLAATAPAAPPKLNGVVRDTTADGLVEVSLGSDDGMTRGLKLYVYRAATKNAAATLVGRIEILTIRADVSVGKTLPDYTKTKIEKGDRVATQIE